MKCKCGSKYELVKFTRGEKGKPSTYEYECVRENCNATQKQER